MSAQDDVLFTVDGQEVTADEFSYVYNKNKDIGSEIDPKTPREYLELYINFKLKVHEAEATGLDTSSRFLREFNSYQQQLARPYLTVKEVNDQVLHEAFNNMNWDIKARHIMLDLPPDALPEDTLRVYNELMNVREQILDGDRTFESAARAISTDTYSARQGGDLGWFTAFKMVYPFERTAYRQDVGEISKPVRTQYGYHIIETTGRRPARGTVEVAHILAYVDEGATQEQLDAAKRKIEEIYERVEAGEDFSELAKNFSDDKATAENGGLLPAFGMKEMLPTFEEAAFSLEHNGDVSEPFQTKIGWHIVKRINHYDIESFDNIKEELIQKIQRDSRSNLGQEVFINQLKKEYDFEVQEDELMAVVNTVDESFGEGEWDGSAFANSDVAIFTFADEVVTQGEFVEYLNTKQNRPRKYDNYRAKAFSFAMDFAKQSLISYEESQLPAKYPEYKYLVNEYREGILLFDLTQELVWNRSATDTAGLKAFYAAHVDNYIEGPRYKSVRISCSTREVADAVNQDLQNHFSGSDILAKYNVDTELAVRVDTIINTIGDESEIDKAAKGYVGVYGVWKESNRWMNYDVIEIIPEGPRPLKEIRGLVTSDYQKYLETEWITELKDKYEVHVNEDVMSDLESEL